MATRPQQIPRESLIQFEPPIESSESRQHLNANMESKPSTEDILNAILPPRRWEQEGRFYLQYVSHNAASREDVANLQKLLDERLLARQARYSNLIKGSQAFVQSERNSTAIVSMKLSGKSPLTLPKEVLLIYPGLLLMRVRDELKMTIAAYQTLYQSSLTFGMRKQMQSEQGKTELELKLAQLSKNKAALLERKTELLNKKDSVEKRIQERRTIDESKNKSEIEFLKYQGKHLEEFLKQHTQDVK